MGWIYLSLIIIINSHLQKLQSIMCHVLFYCCSPLVSIQRIWPAVSKAHHFHIFLSPCPYRVVVLDVSVRPQLLEVSRQLRILRCIVLSPTPNLEPGRQGYPFYLCTHCSGTGYIKVE